MNPSIDPDELARLRATNEPLVVLDVRRQSDFDASDCIVEGARREDPERVADWAASLDAATPIVVYCVKGGQVSQGAREALAARGFDVRYVEGGINAWKARGGEVSPKDAG